MNYCFHQDDLPVKERILKLNDIRENELDAFSFKEDYHLEIIDSFKDKLLSYQNLRFLIVGDFDCDGICSVSIIKRLLNQLNIQSNYYIPSRSKEGYGLSDSIIEMAIRHGFEVVLCVDNGIVANEALHLAKKNGLKTLVIDHHEFESLPAVDACLHPDLFPSQFKDMCASGICTLLANSFIYDETSTVYGGLATLADMVSVFGYNRCLLKRMLQILKEKQIPSIHTLLGKNQPTYDNLSFHVIPKINAVSRMDEQMNVNYVVRYLLDDNSELYRTKIEEINRTRKELTQQMSSLAMRIADTNENIIIVSSDYFKEGLCGLIANRIMMEYGKPVLVLSDKDGILKGSGRSPKGYNFHAYLKEKEELFLTFGGHAQAVGLSMPEKNLDSLKQYIRENTPEYTLQRKDVLVFKQEDFNEKMISEIEKLKPFGTGFEEPLLAIQPVTIDKQFIFSGRYRKYILNDRLEAVDFHPYSHSEQFNTMIGKLKRDDYHRDKLSFVVEDSGQF